MTELVKAEGQQLAPTEKPSMLQAVMQAAMNPDIDPARVKEFLEMAREMERDQERREFNVAFGEAYREISQIKILKNGEIYYPPKAGSNGTGTVIRFIKHEDISQAIKPVLSAHGLVNTYSSELIVTPPKAVTVMTIMHRNGYSKEWRSIPMPLVDSGGGKNDMQGAGSSMTYGRRYVTVAAFDIVAEDADDDGNLGKGTPKVTTEQSDKIDDILSALENHTTGRRAKFMDWVVKQFGVEKVSELSQGPQLEEVMAKLEASQKQAGLKR